MHPHLVELQIGNITFNTYDIGGHQMVRKLWADFSMQVDGVVFMVDAADVARLPEAR